MPETLNHGMFPQCFPVSHTGNIASSFSFLFSRCKLYLRYVYTAGNFNENPSIRALAKILRALASEHSSNFCEQFEQRPNFAITFTLDGTIRYPYYSIHRWPDVTPQIASSPKGKVPNRTKNNSSMKPNKFHTKYLCFDDRKTLPSNSPLRLPSGACDEACDNGPSQRDFTVNSDWSI